MCDSDILCLVSACLLYTKRSGLINVPEHPGSSLQCVQLYVTHLEGHDNLKDCRETGKSCQHSEKCVQEEQARGFLVVWYSNSQGYYHRVSRLSM